MMSLKIPFNNLTLADGLFERESFSIPQGIIETIFKTIPLSDFRNVSLVSKSLKKTVDDRVVPYTLVQYISSLSLQKAHRANQIDRLAKHLLTLNQENVLARLCLAETALLRDYKGIADSYLRQITISGNFPDPVIRALVYSRYSGLLNRANDPQAARFYLEESYQLNNQDPLTLCSLSQLEITANPQRSKELLEQAYQIDPDHPFVRVCYAADLLRTTPQPSSPLLEKALAIYKESKLKTRSIYSAAAQLYKNNFQDLKMALNLMNILLKDTTDETHPSYYRILAERAQLLIEGVEEQECDFPKLIEDLERACALAGKHDAFPYKTYGSTLTIAGPLKNHKKAMELLQTAHRLDPNDMYILYEIAEIYRIGGDGLLKDSIEAIKYYDRVIQVMPHLSEALSGRAMCYINLGGQKNLQSAYNDLIAARTLSPEDGSVIKLLIDLLTSDNGPQDPPFLQELLSRNAAEMDELEMAKIGILELQAMASSLFPLTEIPPIYDESIDETTLD